MPWPVPLPADIAARQAAAQVAAFQQAGLGQVDAVSPSAPLGILNRAVAGSVFGVHVEQARLAQELMPDTAQDWLARHGAVWGVGQEPPAAATGHVLVAGTAGTAIPAGATLAAPSGAQVVVSWAAVLGAGATPVAVIATTPGAAGNMAPGQVLTFTAPIAGVSPQTGTIDSAGLSGGTDLESLDSWRARILARIRAPLAGGGAADYVKWTTDVAPGAIVRVYGGWTGPGTVGVVVAAAGPAALDAGTQAAINTNIQALRPVTAQVAVVAATLHPIAFTLHLNPDSSANRAAAAAALALQLAADAAIGAPVYMSRLDAALANASGEFSHERTLPAGDVALGPIEVASLGAVTWV